MVVQDPTPVVSMGKLESKILLEHIEANQTKSGKRVERMDSELHIENPFKDDTLGDVLEEGGEPDG